MTGPDQTQPAEDIDQAAGEAGALAAASRDGEESDPLGPLDRITEDDDE